MALLGEQLMQSPALLMRITASKPMLGYNSSLYLFDWIFMDFLSFKTNYVIRVDGGIPPLVELLQFVDKKVQIAAAGAIRTLAFKNNENKNQVF